jgi:hypothetical protein
MDEDLKSPAPSGDYNLPFDTPMLAAGQFIM